MQTGRGGRSWVVWLVAGAVVAGGSAHRARVRAEGSQDGAPGKGTTSANAEAVKRGEYLVTGVGCGDCHTPHKLGPNGPEPDLSRLLSGHPEGMKVPPAPSLNGPWIASFTGSFTAWSGPWGISYTANLTPHETGLGTWTEAMFIDAIRNGRHQGRGRPILPPMPWPAFAKFTDADLKAMFAYLRSIPPIQNKVPDPVLAGGGEKR